MAMNPGDGRGGCAPSVEGWEGRECPSQDIRCLQEGIGCPQEGIRYPPQGVRCPPQGMGCPSEGCSGYRNVTKLSVEEKDPMRDSLLSSSDPENDESDDDCDAHRRLFENTMIIKEGVEEEEEEVERNGEIKRRTKRRISGIFGAIHVDDNDDEEEDEETEEEEEENNNNTPVVGSLGDSNFLDASTGDLELDLWEGQFEILRPPFAAGHNFNVRNSLAAGMGGGGAGFRDLVRTVSEDVQMLQQQVGVLAENQVNSDDRFSRVKQDNAALQARVLMLEEQLRESEMRSEDRLSEEQRRNRELITRIEREKQLTVENYTIKLASIDKDKSEADGDIKRMKAQLEKLQKEKSELEDRVSEAEFSASAYQQENSKMAEMARREKDELKEELERSSRVIEELRCEVERLRVVEEAAARKRSPSIDPQAAQQNSDLQETIRQLREENKSLQEQVEDLQAQLLTTRLEEGRNLVTTTNNNSLAAEFEAMTNEEGTPYGSETVEKLKKSLKDAQEANQHLRSYIDGILLNIVENYPQLLEVKQK